MHAKRQQIAPLIVLLIVLVICALMMPVKYNWVRILICTFAAFVVFRIGTVVKAPSQPRNRETIMKDIKNKVDDLGLDAEEFEKAFNADDDDDLSCAYGIATDTDSCNVGFVQATQADEDNGIAKKGCCILPAEDGEAIPIKVNMALSYGGELAKALAVDFILTDLAPSLMKVMLGDSTKHLAKEGQKRVTKELIEQVLEQGVDAAGKPLKKYDRIALKFMRKVKIAEKATANAVKLNPAKRAAKVVNVLDNLLLRKGGKLVGKKIGKSGSTLAVKTATRLLAKTLAKSCSKLAFIAAKMITYLSVPIVGHILLVLDLFSMGLDLADIEGYNNFTENSINAKLLREAHLENEKLARLDGIELPLIFPLQTAFPKEFADFVQPMFFDEYTQPALKSLNEDMMVEVTEALFGDGEMTEEVLKAWENVFENTMNKNPEARDQKIYDALKDTKIGKYVAMYKSMSTPKTIGVSLSVEGIQMWNKKEREDWYKYNDMFDQTNLPTPPTKLGQLWSDAGETRPESGIEIRNAKLRQALILKVEFELEELEQFSLPASLSVHHYIKVNSNFYKPRPYMTPPVALFTNKYYVLDAEYPGTDENPNVKTKFIKDDPTHEKVPIQVDAGHVVSYCEKFRNAKFMGGMLGDIDDANPGIDPKEYCVYFDDGTGELGEPGCVYTQNFCDRMGMLHRYNHGNKTTECYKDAGQEVSEFLFGTTITRGIYRGMREAVGLGCNPCCKLTEYCENRTCHPKKHVGEHVGNTQGWKCLSNTEAFGKCVQCKEGSHGTFLCDAIGMTNGHDCSLPGSCYCADFIGDGEANHDKCVPKKPIGVKVGATADYKCISGKEAHEKCVECKHGRTSTDCKDGRFANTLLGFDCSVLGACYCEDDGSTNHDKCVATKDLGERVGHGLTGHKCKSGVSANERCVECKGGAHSTDCPDGYYCGNNNNENDKCIQLRDLDDRKGDEDYKCKSKTSAHGKCAECKHGSFSTDCASGEYCGDGDKVTLLNGGDVYELDKCVAKKPIGTHVHGASKAWKCASGVEAFNKCVECKGGAHSTDCPDGYYCGNNNNENDKCIQLRDLDDRKGDEDYKCKSKTSAHGKCAECKHGSFSTDCASGEYCGDGDKVTLLNGGDVYELDKCVAKKPMGTHVHGASKAWKCASGLEAWNKCVECKGGDFSNHCAAGYYCKDDKCHPKKNKGKGCGNDKHCRSNKCHWWKCT